MTVCYQEYDGWCCIILLVANGHHNYTKCTKAEVQLRLLVIGRKAARNTYSRNTNKIGIQCICWFYSQENFILFRILLQSEYIAVKCAVLSQYCTVTAVEGI